MEYLSIQLPNGIRIVHKPVDSLVAHCSLTINAGSRDELPKEHGLAHFIEHTIFKGTKKRHSHHVLSYMENVGGEINAYTTKEETCIYGSFTHNHYERWFNLLSDIIFNSTFPEKELEKEKDIIIDEINSYKDNPSEQIYDDFEDLIFKGHPLGRSILGNPRSLKSFKRESILGFLENNYNPAEMVISSVGQIPFSNLVRLAEKYFGNVVSTTKGQNRQLFEGYLPEIKTVKRRNHQSHCILGNTAYEATNPKKTALILLNNVLGGPGLNSRLNMSVREKNGYCYTIDSHYHPFTDTGIFCIYFGTDDEYLGKTMELVHKELKKFRELTLGTLQLKRAKQQ
jgi:predicted Zn-dependent peptidase